MFRRRTLILACLFALAFVAMGARLWQLQIIRHDHYTQMSSQRLHRLRQLPPARGRILDSKGRVLAEDAASFELWFKPAVYIGRGRNRTLQSVLGELTPETLVGLIRSVGGDRDLRYTAALNYLAARDPLTLWLAELLRTSEESQQEARWRVARTLLEAATGPGDGSLSGLTDARRCFSDIPLPALLAIEKEQRNPYSGRDLSCLEVRGGYKRTYPYGSICGHITGCVGALTPEDYRKLRGQWNANGTPEAGAGEILRNGRVFFRVEKGSDEESMIALRMVRRGADEFRAKGYFANEMVGRGGIEEWYNDELRGRHTWRLEQMVKPDATGPRTFIEAGPPRAAVNGTDIRLTIDAEFQKKVRAIFDSELRRLSKLPEHRAALNRQRIDVFNGAAVVLHAHTGEILALVSLPDYDPNSLSADFRDLLKDRRQPLINRAIAGSYPPGSTIKPLVAVAGLEETRINANTHFVCEGFETLGEREYVCMNRVHHGSLEVTDALKSSCNVFFYHAGAALGGPRLARWLSDLGLGKPSGIDLPGERAGHLPKNAFTGRRWSLGETYHLSIGQGPIDATPLQMSLAYAAIINGGNLPRPHLRDDPADPALTEPRSRMRLDPENVRLVEEGMFKVIDHDQFPRGTATEFAKIPGFDYMGKTGSAQKDKRSTHAWLVAAAPYKEPEIVVGVIVPFGNHGGSTCGAIVRRIVAAYFNLPDNADENAPVPVAEDNGESADEGENSENVDEDGAARPETSVPSRPQVPAERETIPGGGAPYAAPAVPATPRVPEKPVTPGATPSDAPRNNVPGADPNRKPGSSAEEGTLG